MEITSYKFFVNKPSCFFGSGSRITKHVGLFFDCSNGQTVQELNTMTISEYDSFVSKFRKSIDKRIDILISFDVQIREPNGVYISYTFDHFRKILFKQ